MPLVRFLVALRESGRVLVAKPPADPVADLGAAMPILEEIDRDARLEAPGTAPAFLREAAGWGAVTLYRACQCLTFREVGPEAVASALSVLCPCAKSAPAAWSADLTLRCLPDLVALARGISEHDPLVAGLNELARAWPLSGAGLPSAANAEISAFAGDPCLLQMYADRILERAGTAPLDPRARDAVLASVGLFTDLAPMTLAEPAP